MCLPIIDGLMYKSVLIHVFILWELHQQNTGWYENEMFFFMIRDWTWLASFCGQKSDVGIDVCFHDTELQRYSWAEYSHVIFQSIPA